MRDYKIELRFDDCDNPNVRESIEKALRISAKRLLTTATLISNGRKPSIAVTGEDLFTEQEQIELVDEDDPLDLDADEDQF